MISANHMYRYLFCRSKKTATIDNVDYNTKLVIRPVCREDTGEYVITATNSSGKDSVAINVIVMDKPSPPQGPLLVSLSLCQNLLSPMYQ